MKTKLILAGIVILVVGATIGAWATYSFAQNLIMENLPIGTASLDENGLIIIEGGVTQSKFAAVATIGVTTGSHVRLSGTDGVQIKKDASTIVGTFGPNVTVFNESTRTMSPIFSGSTQVGQIAEPTSSTTSIAGVETPNGIFDRVFGLSLIHI